MDPPEPSRRSPINFSSVVALLAIFLLCLAFVFAMLASRGRGRLMTARLAARQVRCQAELMAIGKGLEMFANDFGDYPDSRLRRDPVTDYPGGKAGRLSGAHWLARAMGGIDGQGVDEKRAVMGDGDARQFTMKEAGSWARKSVYLDPKAFSKDDRLGLGGDYQATGREVLADNYGGPILYYRLTSGPLPQSETDTAGAACHQDNALITGSTTAKGWDFAQTKRSGPIHCIGQFSNAEDASKQSQSCLSFISFLQKQLPKPSTSKPAGRPTGFLLISAGADGIYGTLDDIVQAGMTAIPAK